jgi:thioesterase domain-containing protein
MRGSHATHSMVTELSMLLTSSSLSGQLLLDKKAISWKSLVPIKPGGSKPPLYIVHGSGLTVLVFNFLAKGMDPDQPVYGLQARGLNGEEPFDKIEDIAAYYISEIIEQNPHGPYCLAGYSFGGIVAFEMAKQFEAMGKEVKMLAIFDTYADYNADYFVPRKTLVKRKVIRQFPKMLFILKSLEKHPIQTIKYQLGFLNSLLMKLGLRKTPPSEEELLSVYASKINEKHYLAFDNYRMTPYNGVVDLFRVKKRLYYLDDPDYLGWRQYAQMGVKVHEIPGDHKTFLLPPNDKELAKVLRTILDERISGKKITNDFLHASNVVLKVV